MPEEEVHLASAADHLGYVASRRLTDRLPVPYDALEEAREMIARVVIEQAFVPFQNPDAGCIGVTLPLSATLNRVEGLELQAALSAVAD